MPYCRRIYFFIEGDTDKRFFDKIIKKLILKKKKYDYVHIHQWRQKKIDVISKLVCKYLEKECKVVFIRDYDKFVRDRQHTVNNINALKEEIIQKFNIRSKNDIFIVIREIESWYLAGVKESVLKRYNITPIDNTININKRKFDKFIPNGMSKSEFLIEITDNFNLKLAKKKNYSFKYFIENIDL